jgi:hypothetical protein
LLFSNPDILMHFVEMEFLKTSWNKIYLKAIKITTAINARIIEFIWFSGNNKPI